MSDIIGDTICPNCVKKGGDSTGNHLMLFSDGGAFCNRCEYSEPSDTFTECRVNFGEQKDEATLRAECEEVRGYPFRAIEARGISQKTCDRFGVRSALSEVNRDHATAHYFPSVSSGEVQGYKIRFLPKKNFGKAGVTKSSAFFGINQCPKQGNKLFITEGEYDALALYEVFVANCDEKWLDSICIVSLAHGASSAKKEMQKNKEFLQGFKEIVCVFDQDEAGKEGAEQATQVVTDKPVLYPSYSEKDPCDMVKKGKGKELYFSCITAKNRVRPEKIISGSDMDLSDFLTPLKKGIRVKYPKLMDKLHGFRYGDGGGELTVICAGSGLGKTTLAREIMYEFNKDYKLKLGHVFLEEQKRKTGQAYLAIDNNVPLGLIREDPTCVPYESMKSSYSELVANDRCLFLDHFGSLSSEALMDFMYHFHYEGCNFVILDHISMVVSGQENSKNGERKDIDILMTKLAAFCEDTGTSVLAVVHLKRPQQGSYNEGKQVSLSDLRGSAAIEQLSHNIIAVEGDQQGDSPNTRFVRVLKNREWGDIGLADTMEYNTETGRLLPSVVSFGVDY